MPLSNKDLSDIAREYAVTKGDITDDKSAITNIQEQIVLKQQQADRVSILYRDAHTERVTPYEIERRWLDGTTYTTITQQQITDAAARTTGNIFFPPSWSKSNAMLTTSGNGNPKTVSPNSENEILDALVEDGGLTTQVNLLKNGQSSGASAATLDVAYSPGATTLTFTLAHSFTIGRFLYVSGSGTSALVKVTGTSSLSINILEIIPPASTIAIGGVAIESIPGFTNTERQNLTSGSYQRILTQLTGRISSAATLYSTALTNQLTQLNINVDAPSQIASAKTSVNTALTAYNTWNSLPATGVGGKWTDTPLTNFTTSYAARNSNVPVRAAQITTALGSVTQNAQGDYSGVGNYLQRFKSLNFLINSSSGPLFLINGLKAALLTTQQKVANNTDKLTTFSNLVRYGAFTAEPLGAVITIDGGTQFSNSDTVVLVGNDLPSIECTIVNIVGNSVTLSITVPKEFTKATKGAIIKRV